MLIQFSSLSGSRSPDRRATQARPNAFAAGERERIRQWPELKTWLDVGLRVGAPPQLTAAGDAGSVSIYGGNVVSDALKDIAANWRD